MRSTNNVTIFFDRDFKTHVLGIIDNTSEVTIFYDPYRLKDVYNDQKNGAATGKIFCVIKFSETDIKEYPLITELRNSSLFVSRIEPKALTIKIPKEANGIEMWFRGERAAYQDFYDSNSGKNYFFKKL